MPNSSLTDPNQRIPDHAASPVKTVIVEDEPACIEVLTGMLEGMPLPISIEGTAETLDAGVDLIRRVQPDLVFLDVEIRDRKGFELFGYFPEINFDVIFTTGHSKYALQAIKVAALDFLLKPIDPEELLAALMKKEIRDLNFQQKMETLQINLQKNQLKRIAIPTLNGLEFVEVDDIVFCQAEDNYTQMHCKSSPTLLVSKTLKKLESLLENRNFFRVNRSTLINLDCLKSFSRGKTSFVTLDNGLEFSISNNRRADFFQRINQL